MECKTSDSKKLFKVFDASKRKRTRKKREGIDDSNSLATDESNGVSQANGRRISSAKASLQDVPPAAGDVLQENTTKRERDSSPSMTRSPVDVHRSSRSPRRNRRIAREGISLALKAGLVSTPRSISPAAQDAEDAIGTIPQDQDSFIYAFLEEAIKRDKKKHRHARRHEESREARHNDASISKDCHKHHRRHRDEHREKVTKEERPAALDQAALFETFAKMCAQMSEKTAVLQKIDQVPRSHSHKSLQCEVASRRDSFDVDQQPVRLRSRERVKDHSPSKIRSYENFRDRLHSREHIAAPRDDRKEKCVRCPSYDKQEPRYVSKTNVRNHEEDAYGDFPPERTATRSYINGYYRPHEPDPRDYDERRDSRTYDDRRRPCESDRRPERDYDDKKVGRKYDDRRRTCEQKTSRSFEMRRDGCVEDDSYYRRTARSDGIKDKTLDDRDYRDRRYYDRINRDKFDEKERHRNFGNLPSKDHRSKRNLERLDRMSVVSRDDDYKDRERYSERERDSGLSVADGETSIISERSNYLRVVKQEISEQREAMDKMMKLWKELMRCFKDISQTQGRDKAVNESANNVRESAAAQLRLWRECMRRYETVARDVGDTDARLMEEINKQRSEMSEMASMWQECLQRYRDMSNDFNSLKQQLATSESPTRPPAPPLVCADGEGPPAAPYRLPPHYPTMPPIPPGYGPASPLRSRASAPPAWWWGGEHAPARRRSSPDSHGSRERRRRNHKDRDRDESRYKDKSKSNGARSEHRHRKR